LVIPLAEINLIGGELYLIKEGILYGRG
jgi:hypothetical protein